MSSRGRIWTLSAFGLVGGALLSVPVALAVNETVDPYAWLAERHPHVIVGDGCPFSEAAMNALSGSTVVPVPADKEPTNTRDAACKAAIRLIKDEGPWWRVLPADVLCERLASRARFVLASRWESRVPTWVVGNERIAVGFSAEIQADLVTQGLQVGSYADVKAGPAP